MEEGKLTSKAAWEKQMMDKKYATLHNKVNPFVLTNPLDLLNAQRDFKVGFPNKTQKLTNLKVAKNTVLKNSIVKKKVNAINLQNLVDNMSLNKSNSSNTKMTKMKRSTCQINLPILLSEAKTTNSQSKANMFKTIGSNRDEIKIRNSNRVIDYDNFKNYKDIHTDDITFIKEKISYANTEFNSTNVKFPDSYFEKSNMNLEKHKNFIRKRTKIDLSNYTSHLVTENSFMNVLFNTADGIDKLQDDYDKVKGGYGIKTYNFDYFSYRKYFNNPVREELINKVLLLNKCEKCEINEELPETEKGYDQDQTEGVFSYREIQRIREEEKENNFKMKKINNSHKKILQRVEALKKTKTSETQKQRLIDLFTRVSQSNVTESNENNENNNIGVICSNISSSRCNEQNE